MLHFAHYPILYSSLLAVCFAYSEGVKRGFPQLGFQSARYI